MSMTDTEFTPQERVQLLRKEKAYFERLREKFRFRWWGAPAGVAVGTAGALAIALFGDVSPSDLLPAALVGAALGAGLYTVGIGYLQLVFQVGERSIGSQLLKAGAAQLQDTIEVDFVTKLVQINFKYLDQYYEQTQNQANKSFVLSAFASLVGLAIVGLGIVMMFSGLVEPAYVTTAAGVASEFIAAVFFYLYNRTISKMSDYHDKLVVTQNISLALKIAEGLGDQARQEAHKQLIDRLSENVNQYLTQGKS